MRYNNDRGRIISIYIVFLMIFISGIGFGFGLLAVDHKSVTGLEATTNLETNTTAEAEAQNIDYKIRNFITEEKTASKPSVFPSRSTSRNPETNWPMLKNTPDRTGASSSSVPGSENAKILWSNQTSPSSASPVVAYGKVYMATGNGYIYCFEETTGRLRWKARLTQDDYASISTPAINTGHIVAFSSGDGSVHRINAYTGELNWTYKLPGTGTTINISYIDHPILIHNGLVFFGAPDKYFYCLDETIGKLVWRYKTDSGLTYDYGITGGAALEGDSVYFGANDGYLYAMDVDGIIDGNDGFITNETENNTKDGDVLWKFYTGDSICSTPVIFQDYVYITVGVYSSSLVDYQIYKLFCINRSMGVKVWDFTTEDHIISSPAIAENRVFFGSLDKKVYCLATDTNTSYWVPKTTNGAIRSSPAVTPGDPGGKVVIGSMDNKLYCYRTNTGVKDWELKLNGPITASPALANDRIFINSQQGKLYSIGVPDTKRPTILSTSPAPNENNVPVSRDITIIFDEPLDLASISTKNIIIENIKKESEPVEVDYDDSTWTITIRPKGYLNVLENYTVTISTRISDCAGNKLDGDFSWSFTTSTNNPPELTNAKVAPIRGYLGTDFEFTVLYMDSDNNPPGQSGKDIKLYIDNETIGKRMDLDRNPGIPGMWNDNDYTNGQQYKLIKKIKPEGIHSFRIWCSDGQDSNTTTVMHQPVVLGAPILKPIPEQYAQEDSELVLNLSEYLSDPDTPLEQLIVNVNSSYVQVNNTVITFLYPNSFNYPSGRTFELVNISITDNDFFTNSQIKIWVEAINDPPVITSIPNLIAIEMREKRINLSNYILDVDNATSELNITEDSQYAYIYGLDIVFHYPPGIKSEKVKLNVSDGEFWSLGNINVKIVSSEVSFVLGDIPMLEVIEDIEFTIDLVEYIIIIKGSTENLALECSSIYAQIEKLTLTFLYPDSFTYSDSNSFENVTITVTDEMLNYTLSTSISITITSVNDGPILNNATIDPAYGNISTSFTFKVYYYDIDGSNNIKVHVVVDEHRYALKKISGDKFKYPGIEYTISKVMDIGYHYFHFTCNDGTGAPNSQCSTEESNFFVTGNLAGQLKPGPGYNETGLDENDLDADGIPDLWELDYGLDPTNQSDALADFDGDNFNNLLEYFGHDGLPGGNDSTDPKNATDKPQIDFEHLTSSEPNLKQWQLIIAVIVVIIIVIITIYYLFLSHGVNKTIKVSKRPPQSKMPESTDSVSSEVEPEDKDIDAEITDGSEFESEFEVVDLEAGTSASENVVPVTEVDLSMEDQPFLDSDVPEEDLDIASKKSTEERTDKQDTPARPKNKGSRKKPKKKPKRSK